MLRFAVLATLIAASYASRVAVVSGVSTTQRIDANIPVAVASPVTVASPATAVVAQAPTVAAPTLVSLAQPLTLINTLGGLGLVQQVVSVPTAAIAAPGIVPTNGAAVVSDLVAPGAIIGANGLAAPASVAVAPQVITSPVIATGAKIIG